MARTASVNARFAVLTDCDKVRLKTSSVRKLEGRRPTPSEYQHARTQRKESNPVEAKRGTRFSSRIEGGVSRSLIVKNGSCVSL